jgi:uncharacterized LabA/DUF88 family protein
MPIHPSQRVGVFVDVQNLYYSAKQFYHAKVNFAHILKRAVRGRELVRAIAYVIKADIKEEGNFFGALEKIGYDVRSKDLQTFYTGAKKGDWDVGIAMDIMRMAAKLDVVILVSGDGDFVDLLEHVKALGCRAEVIAFGKTSSSRITGECDEFIDLGRELDKSLIKDLHDKTPDKLADVKGTEIIAAEGAGGEVKPADIKSFEAAKKPFENRPPKPFEARNGRPFEKKPFENKPFEKRSFDNKPFERRPFENKPFERRPFENKPFEKRPFRQFDDNRQDEASLLQRLNMDQPLDDKGNKAQPRQAPPRLVPQPRPPIPAKPFVKPQQKPVQQAVKQPQAAVPKKETPKPEVKKPAVKSAEDILVEQKAKDMGSDAKPKRGRKPKAK